MSRKLKVAFSSNFRNMDNFPFIKVPNLKNKHTQKKKQEQKTPESQNN